LPFSSHVVVDGLSAKAIYRKEEGEEKQWRERRGIDWGSEASVGKLETHDLCSSLYSRKRSGTQEGTEHFRPVYLNHWIRSSQAVSGKKGARRRIIRELNDTGTKYKGKIVRK
jgi:hypothetical protein